MATKKKELLEQENSAPETTVPVENTPSPDEAQADMAAPADGGDLNELLASMDQPDEDTAPGEDGSSLPELTESEMFGEEAADIAEEVDTGALPSEDDTSALMDTPGSDDAEDAGDASAIPVDDGRPMPSVSLFLKRLRNRNRPSPSGPPAGKRPRRPRVQPRWKKSPQKQSLLNRWLPLEKMRCLMVLRRLRRKILPLWPNRRQRQSPRPRPHPDAPPHPAAASPPF